MKNLKIGKKLLVTFGVIILLFCLTTIVSILSLTSAQQKFNSFYNAGYQITNNSKDMLKAIQSSAKNVGYSMMTSDKNATETYIQDSQNDLQTLQEGITYLRNNFRGDMTLVDNFEKTMSNVSGNREKVYQLAKNNQNEEASELYFNSVQPELKKALQYLTEINTVAEQNANHNFETAAGQAVSASVFLLGVSIVTLLATIFLAIYITKGLTRPILEIENASTKLAEGNLDITISYHSKDELGSLSEKTRYLAETLKTIISDEDYLLSEMANGNFDLHTQHENAYVGHFRSILLSMRKINVNLSNTLNQINQSADQVASGSDQVSSGAQELSQGATEQASSVEELAATINDISTQVKQTAQNALDAHEQTSQAGNAVTTCNQQMQAMISAMDEISNKSTEIGKIIKTIEDIAFQTNILALNAAVEAARAGAAGKGFAVVADEVRNLASKSAEASKNTSTLIEGSIEAVKKGTEIANETAESLLQVVEGAQSVAVIVDKIAHASNEQASSIAQVTQGIDQISSVVQTNSATAEESAAASEELSGQAQILKNLTSQFTLRNSDASQYQTVQTFPEQTEQSFIPTAADKY